MSRSRYTVVVTCLKNCAVTSERENAHNIQWGGMSGTRMGAKEGRNRFPHVRRSNAAALTLKCMSRALCISELYVSFWRFSVRNSASHA